MQFKVTVCIVTAVSLMLTDRLAIVQAATTACKQQGGVYCIL